MMREMDSNPRSPAEFGNFDVSRKGPGRPKDAVPRWRPENTGNARHLASAAARVPGSIPIPVWRGGRDWWAGLRAGWWWLGFRPSIRASSRSWSGRCSPSLQSKRQATY